MDLGINGKIAFVAGGSQGMGAAAASILAAEGCRVAVVARNQERLDHAVERIRSAGGMAIGISADLSTTVGITASVEGVRSAFGPPEIVVAQTNDPTNGNLFALHDDEFRHIFQNFTVSFPTMDRYVF